MEPYTSKESLSYQEEHVHILLVGTLGLKNVNITCSLTRNKTFQEIALNDKKVCMMMMLIHVLPLA